MPYRVSCGPRDGRTIIVSHSAAETLRLFRRLQEDGAENIEISHLNLGALTIEQVEASAAEEVGQQRPHVTSDGMKKPAG